MGNFYTTLTTKDGYCGEYNCLLEGVIEDYSEYLDSSNQVVYDSNGNNYPINFTYSDLLLTSLSSAFSDNGSTSVNTSLESAMSSLSSLNYNVAVNNWTLDYYNEYLPSTLLCQSKVIDFGNLSTSEAEEAFGVGVNTGLGVNIGCNTSDYDTQPLFDYLDSISIPYFLELDNFTTTRTCYYQERCIRAISYRLTPDFYSDPSKLSVIEGIINNSPV